MKLEDYRNADCILFRLPPLHVDSLEDLLAQQLLQAWQQGQSAQQALQQILTGGEAATVLAEQIQQNLEFQRATATQNVLEEGEAKKEILEQEKQQKLQDIAHAIGGEKQQKEQQLQAVQQEVQEKKAVYTAEQAKLDALRARVEEKLKGIGGDQGLETLMNIHKAVQETPTPKEQQKEKSKQKSEEVGQQIGYRQKAEQKETVPAYQKPSPLEGKIGETPVLQEQHLSEEKKPALAYRFFRGVWKVLNYKIW